MLSAVLWAVSANTGRRLCASLRRALLCLNAYKEPQQLTRDHKPFEDEAEEARVVAVRAERLAGCFLPAQMPCNCTGCLLNTTQLHTQPHLMYTIHPLIWSNHAVYLAMAVSQCFTTNPPARLNMPDIFIVVM